MSHGRRRRRRPVVVPRPERIRVMGLEPFAWAEAKLLWDGWLPVLTPQATAIYTFLCLAADRRGVSFYRRDRIGRELGLDDQEVHQALRLLRELDLVAYQPFGRNAADGFHQVLSLPRGGPPARELPHEELLRRIGRIGEGSP